MHRTGEIWLVYLSGLFFARAGNNCDTLASQLNYFSGRCKGGNNHEERIAAF